MTVLVGRSSLFLISFVSGRLCIARLFLLVRIGGLRRYCHPPETFELEVKLREKRKRSEMGRRRGKEEIEKKYGRRTTVWCFVDVNFLCFYCLYFERAAGALFLLRRRPPLTASDALRRLAPSPIF